MYGQHYSGSLFFHLNGKQNDFKNSVLLPTIGDQEGESDVSDSVDMMDILMNKALPIIQNSITEPITDYICTANELETQHKTDENKQNCNALYSYDASIDCDIVLGEVPKINHSDSFTNTKKRATRSQSTDVCDDFMLPPTMKTSIHSQLLPKLSMATSAESQSFEKSQNLHTSSLQIASNPMNPKSFEPDELDIDRNDNNSWRCEYSRFDKDWWMNCAIFDENLEFEYDASPYFIYYGVEV